VTRGSPKRSAGVLRPSASAEGCATRSKAGLARTVPWPARSASSMRRFAARALAWSSSRLGRRALQPRSRGAPPAVSIRIARPSLRYCLIRECLQETFTRTPPLSRRAGRGAEDSLGVTADLAGEDDLHVVRAADAGVVRDQ